MVESKTVFFNSALIEFQRVFMKSIVVHVFIPELSHYFPSVMTSVLLLILQSLVFVLKYSCLKHYFTLLIKFNPLEWNVFGGGVYSLVYVLYLENWNFFPIIDHSVFEFIVGQTGLILRF